MNSAACSKTSSKSRRTGKRLEAWLAFAAMTVFIFATLEAAPTFSRFLWQRALFVPTLAWLFGFAIFFLFHYVFSVVRLRSPLRTSALVLLSAAYVLVLLRTGRIERFHMLEYGVLTLLGLKALAHSMKGALLYLVGFMVVFLVSFADEGFQEILPSRYFTWEDVLVNARSIALAALILACIHGADSKGFLLPFFGEDRRGD